MWLLRAFHKVWVSEWLVKQLCNYCDLMSCPTVAPCPRGCCWRPSRMASPTGRLVRFWAPMREQPESWGSPMASNPGSNRWASLGSFLELPVGLQWTIIFIKGVNYVKPIEQMVYLCTWTYIYSISTKLWVGLQQTIIFISSYSAKYFHDSFIVVYKMSNKIWEIILLRS